ncbi:peptidoglycan-binding protein [Streptomyces sp. MUM 16J]|uniref:peptidoglycan-binding protein n=1 Tax=Streptomyces sp. MUM 16J TaxID=2791988 RepID=UPI0005826490|nr:peptidoglycan-binding protein [Streptomyces sp. MUM 16J]MCH0558867.1 peptidoglycan-binding protein [Streptomyces sp. MUM 16J]
MAAPAFEEFDPVSDCDCPGCVLQRRMSPRPQSGHPCGHPAARGVVVVAVASAALGAVPPAAALTAGQSPHRQAVPGDGEPGTPQGAKAPLHGPVAKPAEPATVRIPSTTRTDIINRAKTWVAAQVPYSMYAYWPDGYRQDCSGYVSMAWGLPGNEWTGSLDQYGVKITKEELQPGDILLYHNPDDPERGSHVVIFGGWTDYTHTYYTAYEQTPPRTRRQITPYAYWSHSGAYVPYRYKGVAPVTAGAEPAAAGKTTAAFPGAAYFGRGADNTYVTQLGRMLVARGGGSYYTKGPGPVWGEADRRATLAFQQAQGWTGADADGLPGPGTWRLLATGRGKDIRSAKAGPALPASHGVPGYPGRNWFRPGATNDYITRLGAQLVKKGFGRFYSIGPGPHWGEADRRAVEAFQRSQGWRGGAADGYPGPETWRRLFT